ncbi:unnamed protein product, partial [Fusarium graminearum]
MIQITQLANKWNWRLRRSGKNWGKMPLPVAVTFPVSTEEVAIIAKICHKRRVPMIPYSGGSSVEGHFSAPFGGISVDFVNMNQILQVHADDLNVVVQPSVPWMDLNEKIKDTGLFFPIDPGPS